MKKLEKKFTMNADKSGDNIFTQLKRENGVAIYRRDRLDGTFKSYEVFIIKTVEKGSPLPNGKTVEETYESYPGAASFGKTASDCRILDSAEERFDEYLEKVKNREESAEESKRTGKPNRGKRTKVKTKINLPKTRFTMKMLITETGLTQPQLYPIVKQWLKESLITVVESVKAEGGRGRPSFVYEVTHS
jgi:hypothetical protein